MQFKILNIVLMLLMVNITFGQLHARIEGNILSKETLPSGAIQLNSGKFYYDTKYKKVVYDMKFPNIETIITKDTTTYILQNGALKNKIITYAAPETSIFHLALTGKINNFGLDNKNIYKIDKYEKQNDKVIVSWKPKVKLDKIGPIKMMLKENKLEAIIFYDPAGTIIAKQYFKNYSTVSGVDFPGEVIFVNIKNKKESFRVIKYHKIKINDFKSDNFYNFSVPGVK
jgi:hypothetical protein